MSGCQPISSNSKIDLPKETLSLCSHKIPIKFGCYLCDLEIRIDKIELQNKIDGPTVIWNDYLYLLDQKKILEKRCGDLEEKIECFKDINNSLVERIEKLEQQEPKTRYVVDKEATITINMIKRIEELEQLVSNLSQKNDVAKLSQEDKKICTNCNDTGLFISKKIFPDSESLKHFRIFTCNDCEIGTRVRQHTMMHIQNSEPCDCEYRYIYDYWKGK